MLPLSFKEYLSAFDIKEKSRYEYFLDYMKNGDMPGNIPIIQDNPNDLDTYLEGIFTTIIYKDIITKNNIKDKMLLENILKFLFDSIGSPISTKKISDTLTSKEANLGFGSKIINNLKGNGLYLFSLSIL